MMTKLEELINELCPDGVEYVKIKDYFIRLKGTPITAAKMKEIASNDGEIKVFAGGKTVINAYEKDIPKANITRVPAVLVQSRGVIDVVYYDNPFTFKNEMWAYTHNEQTTVKYLYYFLSTQVNKMRESASGMGSLPQISLKVTEEMQIPLPPLSIQSEIVHILDSFTLLTAELTAELTARQKQYAFYRDYLLDFSNENVTKKIPDIDCSNVEYKRLGDIATAIYRGAGIKRDEVTETGIPCVRYGEIYTTYNVTFNNCVSHTDEDKIQNKKYFEHGDVLFAITGESVEEIAKSCVYLGHDKCLAGGDIVVLKHNQNPKYMAYVLSTTNAQSQKSKGKVKSKVVHSSVPAISDIIIPIPPLAEQEKIANMIVRFDHLCNDISNGLPAEIEARKKQYEYYRDTLLSFDDKACSQIVKVERERELTRSKAIKWLKLSDVSLKITDGMHNLPKDVFPIGDYPIISAQNVNNGLITTTTNKYVNEATFVSENKRTNLTNGDVLLTIVGAIGRIAIVENDLKALCQRSLCVIKPNYSIICSKYLKFVLESTPVQNYIIKNAHGAAQKGLYLKQVSDICIPVPSLEEQERIVSILDRFDKLCNDISEGLPAEIEARQKQYEYYRDKLLSFKEKNHA